MFNPLPSDYIDEVLMSASVMNLLISVLSHVVLFLFTGKVDCSPALLSGPLALCRMSFLSSEAWSLQGRRQTHMLLE